MRIDEGYSIISKIPAKTFGQMFTEQQMKDIRKNKGKSGQLLETVILNLKLSNRHLDFEDGELKSNKVKCDGSPSETIAICQINRIFDKLIAENLDPYSTEVYDKIKSMIYVAIDKSSKDEKEWKIHHCILVKDSNIKFKNFYEQCAKDLIEIFSQIRKNLNNPTSMLHTTSGKYLQIRTKDSVPYRPIYSKVFNRYVSDKNFAVYMTTEGIKALNEVN